MKLNRNQRDEGLLTLVLGILIFFVSCYFGFRNFYSETQQLRMQNEILNEQLAELEKIAGNKEMYVRQTKELQRGMEEKIRQFSSELISEEIVLYMEELEQKSEVHISAITIPERSGISIEQESNPSEVSGEDSAVMENNNDAENETSDAEQLSFSCIESNITYSSAYSELKDLIKLITTDKNRKSIDNVSGVFDENTGKVSGTMTVNYFILEGNNEK